MNDHIASVCHKYGLDKESTVNRMSVMVDKEHKVAFCRNAKVYSYVVHIKKFFFLTINKQNSAIIRNLDMQLRILCYMFIQ